MDLASDTLARGVTDTTGTTDTMDIPDIQDTQIRRYTRDTMAILAIADTRHIAAIRAQADIPAHMDIRAWEDTQPSTVLMPKVKG